MVSRNCGLVVLVLCSYANANVSSRYLKSEAQKVRQNGIKYIFNPGDCPNNLRRYKSQLCAFTYTKVCSDAVGYSIKRIQTSFLDLFDTELNVQKIGENMRTIFSGFPDNPTPDSIQLYVERVNRTIQRQVAKYAKHLDKWDDSAFRNYGGPYYHFINRFAEFVVLRCIHHLYRKHF